MTWFVLRSGKRERQSWRVKRVWHDVWSCGAWADQFQATQTNGSLLYLVSWQSLEIPGLKIHINDGERSGTVISISAVERRAQVSFSWAEGEFTAVSMSGSTAPHRTAPPATGDVNLNNSVPSGA